MSKMKEMQIAIEEIARIALEDPEMSSRIGHELDLSDEYMRQIFKYLDRLLNEGGVK